MKGINVRHSGENVRIPYRHTAMSPEIFNVEMSEKDTGVYSIGTIEHVIREEELTEKQYDPNQHDGQQGGEVIAEILDT